MLKYIIVFSCLFDLPFFMFFFSWRGSMRMPLWEKRRHKKVVPGSIFVLCSSLVISPLGSIGHKWWDIYRTCKVLRVDLLMYCLKVYWLYSRIAGLKRNKFQLLWRIHDMIQVWFSDFKIVSFSHLLLLSTFTLNYDLCILMIFYLYASLFVIYFIVFLILYYHSYY